MLLLVFDIMIKCFEYMAMVKSHAEKVSNS